MEENKLKQFAIKLGCDFLEIILMMGFAVLIFPFTIKAMEWFASLSGYHL